MFASAFDGVQLQVTAAITCFATKFTLKEAGLMFHFVGGQVFWQQIRIRTMRTFVWSHICMVFCVFGESGLGEKCFATIRTLIRLVVVMETFMNFQVAGRRKSFAAHFTFVRSIAGMCTYVHSHIAFLSKFMAAIGAREFQLRRFVHQFNVTPHLGRVCIGTVARHTFRSVY